MRGLFGHIERYVLRRTAASLAGALAIISAMILLIDFVDNARNLGSRSDASFIDILFLTSLKSPNTVLTLLPFIFLFGVLSAFVSLNRSSELVAMRAAGVSAWRFLWPAVGLAFGFGLLAVTVLNPLAAIANSQFERSQTALREDFAGATPQQIWLRQGDERTEMIIHAGSYDRNVSPLGLRDVSLFIYTRDLKGDLEFSRRIEAQRAELNAGFWRLTGVREATPGAGAVRSESLSLPSTLDSEAAMERFVTPSTVPVWRLPAVIRQLDNAGVSSLGYRVRLHQVLATPVLYAAMALLAGAFSLRLMRLGGLAGLAVSAVGLGFGFFFFDRLCLALGRSETLPPALAAWTPPLLALLLGLTLLCYMEDG